MACTAAGKEVFACNEQAELAMFSAQMQAQEAGRAPHTPHDVNTYGFHGYNIHLNANGIQWSAHSGPEYSTAMELAEVRQTD